VCVCVSRCFGSIRRCAKMGPSKAALAAAMTSRDMLGDPLGNQPLVTSWRKAAKPKKGAAVPAPLPDSCDANFPVLFEEWLALRGIFDAVEFDRQDDRGWRVYRYKRDPPVQSKATWEQAFHGTWWYAVWSILESGIVSESNYKTLGHDYSMPGVYCSPRFETAEGYARPQILFGDGVYHRIVLELRVDPVQQKKRRKKEWVYPSAGVSLHSIHIKSNAPPYKGEERLHSWDPALEASPHGAVPAVPSQLPEPVYPSPAVTAAGLPPRCRAAAAASPAAVADSYSADAAARLSSADAAAAPAPRLPARPRLRRFRRWAAPAASAAAAAAASSADAAPAFSPLGSRRGLGRRGCGGVLGRRGSAASPVAASAAAAPQANMLRRVRRARNQLKCGRPGRKSTSFGLDLCGEVVSSGDVLVGMTRGKWGVGRGRKGKTVTESRPGEGGGR